MAVCETNAVLLPIIAVNNVDQRSRDELHLAAEQFKNRLRVHFVVMITPDVEDSDVIFLRHFSHDVKEKAAGFALFPSFDSFLDGQRRD